MDLVSGLKAQREKLSKINFLDCRTHGVPLGYLADHPHFGDITALCLTDCKIVQPLLRWLTNPRGKPMNASNFFILMSTIHPRTELMWELSNI
ncbi:hypothetical protein J6590_059468 [Homalodisca vitripennis]|nr:hypothetical protein J6590_059468 [Homalodisca vitripennis]